MFSVDLSTRECDGHVIVALRGELDVLDAAGVAGTLAAITVREPRVIVDLAGLEFIDASGLAALVSARKHARHAGGDLLLAAPQRRVLRVLAATHLLDLFSVHPSVEKAVRSAGSSRQVAAAGGQSCRPCHQMIPAGFSTEAWRAWPERGWWQ